MMRVEFNLMQIFLVLVVFQKECRAIDCFQCNSKKDEDCTISRVSPKYLQPCPRTHVYCRKAVYIHYFAQSREQQIIRECARWQNAEKDCYSGRYTRDSYQLVCECKGAACNRPSTSASGSVLLRLLCQLILLHELTISPF